MKEIDTIMKQELVREELQKLVKRLGSQRKAANQLGIGTTTVGDIIRGDLGRISEEMLQKIGVQLARKVEGWVEVETNAYKEITAVLDDAQQVANCTWVVAEAGAGKSTTARTYAQSHANVVYVLCSEDMRRGDFLDACLRAMGEKSYATSLKGRMDEFLGYLRDKEHPLLVLDEADKLVDSIMLYCVSIYNQLEGHCGMVMLSTNYIEKRMGSGLRCNKRGYNELHSRIGRRFYVVDRTTPNDVYGICMANGLVDESLIGDVIRDAERYDFDLRRVKKCVLKYRG
ncbi:hypothetical protein IX308_000425 [Porphyromonas levii]|nr:hypothetical protein [Porphyromonas levii]